MLARRARRLALAVALMFVGAAAAQPDAGAPEDAAARFDRATAMIAAGDAAGAARELVALAGDAPGSPRAADALFLAAELREERLDDPSGAAELYRRIGREHPDSRVALAAERRLADLERLLGGPGDEKALAEYYEIRREVPESGAAAALDRAEALLATHPDLAAASEIRLWMAGVAERAGMLDRAAALYDRVLAGPLDADASFDTLLRAGTLAVRRGDFDRAESLFERLPASDSPGRREARRQAFATLSRARLRAHIFSVALALLVLAPLLLIASLVQATRSPRAAARALWPPPVEAIYLAPVAAVFAVFAVTSHHAIARAVIEILAAGLAITWLSGAGLRAARPSRWRPLVHAALAGLTVLAICYALLARGGLAELIVSTVRFGPDI